MKHWSKTNKREEIIQKIVSTNAAKRVKYIFSDATRQKMSDAKKGEKHPLWKGGVTPKNHLIRKSLEYKLWRKSVFERDNYTCIWCGFKGYIEADHIKPFCDYPELRFSIDNGRTLCKPCHKKTGTWGINSKLK